jgi:ABC-type dipeptide/oligopeptide/nickel transport system ATPase component|tara:strand:+ start:2215 stop:3003 length:789 start_codon:yes stop_codon:yes gene_type:complete
MMVLQVNNLKSHFFTEEGIIKAVDGINFNIAEGEILGIVGETGCGKTVTALSIMRLLPEPGRIIDGEIFFKGEDLLKKDKDAMRRIRGKEISMIFQDPLASFNPVFKIGDQIAEILQIHLDINKKKALEKAQESLELVKIHKSEEMLNQYPHELSGGMRQRAMIAMAIACNPSLLIADEPTTALDVTIQSHILELIRDLIKKLNFSVLLITHNLGVVAEICDRVAIMNKGKIVEQGDVSQIFNAPSNEYTKNLLNIIHSLYE